MKEIWVFADLRNERLLGLSLKALSKARSLAGAVPAKVCALVMGSTLQQAPPSENGSPACLPLSAGASRCASHGADGVYVFDHPSLSIPRADMYAAAFSDLVREKNPMLVLFALTDFGREMAARCARIAGSGLIADCLDLFFREGRLVAACPSWGGEILAEISFVAGEKTGFATVRPQGPSPEETAGREVPIVPVPVKAPEVPTGLKLLSRTPEPDSGRKLEDAQVVVVGGAGLGNPEAFTLTRELAAALGGEVGATRPPVLSHWVSEDRLIGQTGKSVRPGLLISIGTSGAIQYTAGIADAGTIVAINRDPHAAIFQMADLGVVADAKSFLPALIRRVKQAVMRRLADSLCAGEGPASADAFGSGIRKVREAHGWSREDLAVATGQTPDFIERIESGKTSPSVAFLLRLSAALKVDPGTFLRKEEKAKIRDLRTQAFTRRTENYSYLTLTSGAENDQLHAFLVTIEPRQSHKPVAYKHDGEEFIFVLEGGLELSLGGKAHDLKAGESIHFHSNTPHKLKSLSTEATRCLVVLCTP